MRFILSLAFLMVVAVGIYAYQNVDNAADLAAMQPAAGDAAEATPVQESPVADAAPAVVPTTEGPAVADAPTAGPDCGVHDGLIGKNVSDVDTNNQGPEVKSVRVVRPGEAVTMDYMMGRLTIEVDANGVITKATCG